MDFFQEPTFTAFLALILSILVARIVYFVVSKSSIDSNTVVCSVNEGRVEKGVVVGRLSKGRSGKGKKRVKFVDDFVIKRVDRYEGSENIIGLKDVEEQSVDEKGRERVDQENGVNEDSRGEMIEEHCSDEKGFEKDEIGIEEKCCDDKMEGFLGENEMSLETSGVKNVILENQKDEMEFEGSCGFKSAILENKNNEVEFEGDDKVIDEKGGIGEEGIVENEGMNKGKVEEEGRMSIESDDDWEGIERSELERVFAEAVNYVEFGGKGNEKDNDRLAKLGSDVQMELYGLHKVSVEGTCHEPQPMAFKVSARAKWNAWQRLGSMSQEVAMEQYIRVLSVSIPQWMHDHSADDDVQGSLKSETVGEILVPTHERTSELSATPIDYSSTGQCSVDSVQKDD